MTTTSDRARIAVVVVALACGGCGLERPPDPPPFDCATIDRAAERFPDECGPDTGVPPEDAAADDDAGDVDAGS
jgi:hypothetical protein